MHGGASRGWIPSQKTACVVLKIVSILIKKWDEILTFPQILTTDLTRILTMSKGQPIPS